jgi:GH35 family endo-1,4-beta-xylanase
VRDRHVTGAVGANPGGAPARPRFFPSPDELKAKVAATDAQLAQIMPLFERAQKEIGTAFAAREFPRIGEIREATTDAITALLAENQRAPFLELMRVTLIGPPPPPLTAEEQRDLARRYGDIFAVFLKHRAAITRVTFWGLRDSDSWRRRGQPLLFDDNYARKPAYDAVIAAAKQAGLN